jgi:ElaB/YqjD/DUF883 family membrane-anchored ribosome-binding protein
MPTIRAIRVPAVGSHPDGFSRVANWVNELGLALNLIHALRKVIRMATTSDRLRKRARKVTKDLHKMNGIARNGVRKNLRKLGANTSGYYEHGIGKMHQAERRAVQIIRDRPIRSALIALGVGLVLGGFWFLRFTTARPHTNSDA